MGKREYQHLHDTDLVKEYLKDENDIIFREIYLRYNKKIFYYIKKYLYYESHDIIEEIVNDVFIKIYVNISKLKNIDKFRSWVYQIAHNRCVNHIEAQHSRKEFSLLSDQILDKKADFEEHFLENELLSFVFKEISKFDDKIREVIVLKYYQNLTYNEISEVTNISVRSLKYIIKKTFIKIDNKLKRAGFY